MTQEDKELLLKDLSARLPYGVKYNFSGNEGCDYELDIITRISVDDAFPIEDCKPYLRPMSSMTEEEWKEYNQTIGKSFSFTDEVDWLNAHHFDYRGLIEKGLSLEAPDGMYSDKNEKTATPQTLSEAISYLTNNISDEDKQYIIKNGAISVHHSLGRWIRNNWGLWENSELKRNLEKEGLTHPDDMSNYIIEEFLKTLTDSEK